MCIQRRWDPTGTPYYIVGDVVYTYVPDEVIEADRRSEIPPTLAERKRQSGTETLFERSAHDSVVATSAVSDDATENGSGSRETAAHEIDSDSDVGSEPSDATASDSDSDSGSGLGSPIGRVRDADRLGSAAETDRDR